MENIYIKIFYDNIALSVFFNCKATSDQSQVVFRNQIYQSTDSNLRKVNFSLCNIEKHNGIDSIVSTFDHIVNLTRLINQQNLYVIDEYSLSKFILLSLGSIEIDYLLYLVSTRSNTSMQNYIGQIEKIIGSLLETILIGTNALTRNHDIQSESEIKQYTISLLKLYSSVLSLINNFNLCEGNFNQHHLNAINKINVNISQYVTYDSIFATTVIFLYIASVRFTNNINTSFLIIDNEVINILANALGTSIKYNNSQITIGLIKLFQRIINHFQEDGLDLLIKYYIIDKILSLNYDKSKTEYDDQGKSEDYAIWLLTLSFLQTIVEEVDEKGNNIESLMRQSYDFLSINKERINYIILLFKGYSLNNRQYTLSNLEELCLISSILFNIFMLYKNWIMFDKDQTSLYIELSLNIICCAFEVFTFDSHNRNLNLNYKPYSKIEKIASNNGIFQYEIDCLLVDIASNFFGIVQILMQCEDFYRISIFNQKNIQDSNSNSTIYDSASKGMYNITMFYCNLLETRFANTHVRDTHFSLFQLSTSISTITNNMGISIGNIKKFDRFEDYSFYHINMIVGAFAISGKLYKHGFKIKGINKSYNEKLKEIIYKKIDVIKGIFNEISKKYDYQQYSQAELVEIRNLLFSVNITNI